MFCVNFVNAYFIKLINLIHKGIFLLNIYYLVAHDYRVHFVYMCICRICAKGMLKIDPNSRLITPVDPKNSKEK